MSSNIAFELWLAPAVFLAAGVVLGLVAEKVGTTLLLRAAKKVHFDSLAILAKSLRGMVFLWVFLAALSGSLTSTPLNPESARFLSHVPPVLFLFSLTIVLARIAVGLFDLHTRKKSEEASASSLLPLIIRLAIYAIGFMLILQSLGVTITPVLTAMGVGGLAVALALQETLSNLFAGMQILAARQVKPGDFVRLESGEEGYVTDVTWRNTTIRAINHNMVIVPNSKLAAAILTNYHQPRKEMLVYVPVGVHYDSDLSHVERVTLEVAREVQAEIEGARKNHQPRIRYNEFGNSSINFMAILAVDEFMGSYLVTHEFIKRLHKRFKEEGIVIPFPMRTLHIPDNPEITVNLRQGSVWEEKKDGD